MKNIKWIPKKYQQHLCEVYKEGMLWNCYTKEGYIFSVTETEHVCATTQHGLLKLIKTIVKT